MKILKILAISCGIAVVVIAAVNISKKVKSSRWEKEMSHSEEIAANAADLLDSGDTTAARHAVSDAFPKDVEDRDRPYDFEAERVLRAASAGQEVILKGHTDNVNSVGFSPDDRYIVSASDDRTICLWDAVSFNMEKRFTGHQGRVQYAAVSSDGKYIVSYSNDDRSIIFWNIQHGGPHEKIDVDSDIKGFCLSSSGHVMAYSTSENEIVVVDIDSSETKILKGHESDVHLMEFNYNDKYLLSASMDKTFRIWELSTCEQYENIKTYYGRVSSFFIGGDELIYMAVNDSTIVYTTGVIGMEFDSRHTQAINSATFSPDKKYAVSASEDKSVIAWKIINNRSFTLDAAMIFKGHSEPVNHAVFSHDGTRIASASDDHTVRVWEFPPLQKLIDRTKEEAARPSWPRVGLWYYGAISE